MTFLDTTSKGLSPRRGCRSTSLLVIVGLVLFGLLTSLTRVERFVFETFGDGARQDTIRRMAQGVERVKHYVRVHDELPMTLEDAYGVGHAPADGWGYELTLVLDGDGYDIVSLGADGRPGGTGQAADLNWQAVKESWDWQRE